MEKTSSGLEFENKCPNSSAESSVMLANARAVGEAEQASGTSPVTPQIQAGTRRLK